jgi:hypothetical protein
LTNWLGAHGVTTTPNAVYKATPRILTGGFTDIQDLQTAAIIIGGYLLNRYYSQRSAALQELIAMIAGDHAPICLVKYTLLQKITGERFSGAHFLIPWDFDAESIYVADSLPKKFGGRIAVPHTVFLDAWGGFASHEDPNYACLVG